MKQLIIFLLITMTSGAVYSQKSCRSNYCTSMEASTIKGGGYEVAITNKTSQAVSYQVIFPNGTIIKSTGWVQPGETIGLYQGAEGNIHGSIIAIPNNQAISNCSCGSVRVNV